MNNYAALEKSLRTTTAKPGVFTDEDIAEYKKAWSEPGVLTGMLSYYRANIVKRFLSKPVVPPKIEIPTLFIYGEQDKAVLSQTVVGVGDMIDAPYTEVRIPGSGHWVQQEAKEEVTGALKAFLAA
jgi:pimeloyl-ACP methyl ester carboxylesterase